MPIARSFTSASREDSSAALPRRKSQRRGRLVHDCAGDSNRRRGSCVTWQRPRSIQGGTSPASSSRSYPNRCVPAISRTKGNRMARQGLTLRHIRSSFRGIVAERTSKHQQKRKHCPQALYTTAFLCEPSPSRATLTISSTFFVARSFPHEDDPVFGLIGRRGTQCDASAACNTSYLSGPERAAMARIIPPDLKFALRAA